MTTHILNIVKPILSRIENVAKEILAFGANILHVLRGDLVVHVVTPVENLVKKIEADVK